MTIKVVRSRLPMGPFHAIGSIELPLFQFYNKPHVEWFKLKSTKKNKGLQQYFAKDKNSNSSRGEILLEINCKDIMIIPGTFNQPHY